MELQNSCIGVPSTKTTSRATALSSLLILSAAAVDRQGSDTIRDLDH